MFASRALVGLLALATFAYVGTMSAPPAAAAKWCFRVIAPAAVNIRKRPWSKSPILGVAKRGEVLRKWKLFCSWRGFWCPVENTKYRGYADKRFLRKIECPT